MNKQYHVREIARILGLTKETARTYLKKGIIKGIKINGHWRVDESDLKRLINGGEIMDELTACELAYKNGQSCGRKEAARYILDMIAEYRKGIYEKEIPYACGDNAMGLVERIDTCKLMERLIITQCGLDGDYVG